MYWKLAGYTKQEGEIYSPCVHNTVGIPDHMVIADSTDIPVVEMRYDYASMEERTYAEVVELIKCMNLKGKFVSKEWICSKLNFKSRKADDIIANLKRQGVIVEMFPVRHAKKLGCFYRMAGNAWKRKVQKAHASIRREQRALNREIYSPKKGSRNEQPFSNLSDSGESVEISPEESEEVILPETPEDHGFEVIKKGGKNHNVIPRNYPDGSPGDGREHTCYSAYGCYNRITYPDSVEFELTDILVGLSQDQHLYPALARSIARRIDSGLISFESVAKMQSIFKNNPSLAYTLRDLIYNYSSILAEYSEKFHTAELSFTASKINNIVDGTSYAPVKQDIGRAMRYLHGVGINSETSTYDQLCAACAEPTIPVYSKILAALCIGFSPSTLRKVASEFKESLFKQIAENKIVYECFEGIKVILFDWTEFISYFKNYIADLKCSLYINKLRNPKLDAFFNILKFKNPKDELSTNQHNPGYCA